MGPETYLGLDAHSEKAPPPDKSQEEKPFTRA